MKSPLPSLVTLLALAFGSPMPAGEFATLSVKAPEGPELKARLLSPAPHGGKVPLVVVLHGAGERGTDNNAQLKYGAPLFQKENEKYPCYVLAPQCPPDQKWVEADWSQPFTTQPAEMTWPTKLLVQMIDELCASQPDVDLDRIYLTGLSMGGYGTWDLITRFPAKFAAAIPICGGGDVTKVAPVAQVPIWTFHGDLDPLVPVSQTRSLVAALEQAGGHPLYSEYPNVRHESWKNAYGEPELLPWLFAQRRGQAPVPFEKVATALAQPPSHSFPGTGPIQEGLWFRPLWQTKRQEWSRETANDQGAIVFLGDSITQGWSSLAQDFAGYKVANRGISGDTTRGVLYRLPGDVLEVHPSAVSLLIGTNDLGLGSTPEVAATNFQLILAELHRGNPKMPVILNLVMPSTAAKNRPAAKLQALNGLLKEAVAHDPLVTVIDTYALFANQAGDAKLEEFPDLLHPNAVGYAKWKALLEATFQKLGLGQAAPKAAAQGEPKSTTVLQVQADGSVLWGQDRLPAADLTPRLRQLSATLPDASVLIRAEETTVYARITAVLEACRDAQVWNVSFTKVQAPSLLSPE